MSKKDIRHSKIIEYLNNNGEISTAEFIRILGVKKSTFSEDITELKSKGYPLNTSHHGFISLSEKKDNDEMVYFENISKDTIRKWLLLYTFNIIIATNGGPASTDVIRETLLKIYGNINNSLTFSEYNFNKDIRELLSEGYLRHPTDYKEELFKSKEYHTTFNTPRMIIVTKKSVHRLITYLETEPDNIIYSELKKRISALYAGQNQPSVEGAETNTIPAIKYIDIFLRSPYETNQLNIKYKTAKNNISIQNFETGLIMYSSEKNRFYILGECDGYKKPGRVTRLIRADKITSISESSAQNKLYMSPDINSIYEYIFEGSLEDGNSKEPVDTEMLIVNTPQNLNRLLLIKNSRPSTASVCILKLTKLDDKRDEKYYYNDTLVNLKHNGEVLLYKDKILGTTDMLPLIRSFGKDIQVIAPISMEKLITSQKPLHKKLYENAYRYFYNTDIQK